MHDIWNPWHGCIKCSEGCQNCYMYYLDSLRDKDGVHLYKPIQVAEILYRDRTVGDIDLARLETYRTKSKKWRDAKGMHDL